jgi:hypothetical protein
VPAHAVVPRLTAALSRCGVSDGRRPTVVDLCSGSGGPITAVVKNVDVCVRLTDLFPNMRAFESAAATFPSRIEYVASPVDATQCKESADLRTLHGSFHHFRPQVAEAMLRDAVAANTGILIVEATERSVLVLALAMYLLFPMALVLTALRLRRHFSFRRFVFTFCFPIVPLTLLVDGIISCLRTYTRDEFLAMANRADPKSAFDWSYERTWPLPITFYVGVPKAARRG